MKNRQARGSLGSGLGRSQSCRHRDEGRHRDRDAPQSLYLQLCGVCPACHGTWEADSPSCPHISARLSVTGVGTSMMDCL